MTKTKTVRTKRTIARGRSEFKLEREPLKKRLTDCVARARYGYFQTKADDHSFDLMLLQQLVPNIATDRQVDDAQIERLIAVVNRAEGVEPDERFWIGSPGNICHYCGNKPEWWFDGRTFTVVNCCTYSGAHPATGTLAIHSGEIAFGTDFREEFRSKVSEKAGPTAANAMFEAESYSAQAHASINMAAAGCAFGFLEGHGVSLFSDHRGGLFIASASDAQADTLGWRKLAELPERAQTFSITDMLYRDRTTAEGEAEKYVRVTPGNYSLTVNTYLRNFDSLADFAVHARLTLQSAF